MNKPYLRVGKASDLSSKKDRFIYRTFEILPGFLAWLTLFLAVFLSFKAPVIIAFFIITFDLYWLFRITYFSFLLRGGYKKMKEYEKIDWLSKLKKLKLKEINLQGIKSYKDIYHLIVFPIFREPLEIIKNSFQALLNSDYPKDKMIVVLAIEERAGKKGEKIAKIIKKEYGKKFFKFLITKHPSNLPAEIAGKGSNETWALKKTKKTILDKISIPYQNIIVSSFDGDTVVSKKYFSCLTYHYLTTKKPTKTSFQPIPLYINNIWQTSAFSRVFSFSSTFWHTMNQERPDKLITFSSHSMSFKALVEVDFKQVNVISEDSRIFWQCFLYYDGDYRVLPLYYPVSMDAVIAKTFWQTAKNLYKQQRRWAYGVENIPYMLFGFLKNKKIPLKKKITLSLELLEGHWTWATAPFLIFFLGWLPLILGGADFNQTLLSYNLPQITSKILTVAMIGIIVSIYFSFQILPPKKFQYGKLKYLILILQWFLIPLIMIFFSALPALDAQTRWFLGKHLDFWPTEKIR